MINEKIISDIVMEVVAQVKKEKNEAKPLQSLDCCCEGNKCINSKGCGKGDCDCSQDDKDEITAQSYRDKLLIPNPKDEKAYRYMKGTTPARIGVWRAGDRPLTETLIRFRADHAMAIDSVFSTVDEGFIKQMNWLSLKTSVEDKDQHLTRPDLGRELCSDSQDLLLEKCIRKPRIQIIISDGLSSKAVEANMADILPAFIQGLKLSGVEMGTPVFVKFGRVGVMDAIGEDLCAEAAIIFIGERPGLITAESLSAYMIYNPRRKVAEAERTVLSNIHSGGTPPVEAGAHLAMVMKNILDKKASGINLKK